MKLLIAALRDRPTPGRGPELKDISLEQRVQYALDCLDSGDSPPSHEQEARDFLMKVKARQFDLPDDIKNRIDEALAK